jgi:hypothetical protein|nr:MAG TPA: hypothetical protein [Crassvirales sp.]
MDTLTKIIIAILFCIIESTEIITYLIQVDKLQKKSEIKLLFFQTLSKVLFICVIFTMFQLVSEIFTILHE